MDKEIVDKRIVLLVTLEMQALLFYRGYIRFLTESGCDVTVIAKSEGQLETWASREGGEGISVNFTRNPSPLHDFKTLLRTIKLLREIRPDIVVSATPKAGLVGMLSAKILHVPVRIYQLWGLRLETEVGLKRRLLWFFEKLAIRSSTQTLANSKSLARVAVRLGVAPVGKVGVIGQGSSHGVDTNRFSPDSKVVLDLETQAFLEAQESDLTVAFIGRIARDKGIHTLLEALRIASDHGVSIRAMFVGLAEDRNVLEQLESASSEQIHVVEHVSDVRPYLRAADVLCLPSLREGFPNVVLEAAAMGVAAVVSDATGAVDSVVDKVTGRVFPVGESHKLAAILEELGRDPQKLQDYGRRARLRVDEHFNQRRIWELQLENIVSLLETV